MLPIYFSRHKLLTVPRADPGDLYGVRAGRDDKGLDITMATFSRLIAERRVGVHFPYRRDGSLLASDNDSKDSNGYPSPYFSGIINSMKALADHGGYVCALFEVPSVFTVYVLGRVDPGQHSDIELFQGEWLSLRGHQAILKTVRIGQNPSVLITAADDGFQVLCGARKLRHELANWENTVPQSVRNLFLSHNL